MARTRYRMVNPIDGEVRRTNLAFVAERYRRNGHRVFARTVST